MSFLLPYPWSRAALAHTKRPAVEAGEVLPEAQRAGSASVFSLLTPWAFPIWQCRLSSRQGRADNLHPPAPGKSARPLKLAGDDPPGGSSVMHCGRRSSAQDFWWLCSCFPLRCAFGKSFKCAFQLWREQVFWAERLWEAQQRKMATLPTGFPPGPRQLKIKFSSSSSVSSAFN